MEDILDLKRYPDKTQAETAAKLLNAAGIKASTRSADLGHAGFRSGGRKTPLLIFYKDAERADLILALARDLEAQYVKGPPHLPPDEGTMEFLDMLIHDCRQYLLIATGKIKSIEEEGELALDEPTKDIRKVTIRLKRLKSQCMGMARKLPLDWEHGGGLRA